MLENSSLFSCCLEVLWAKKFFYFIGFTLVVAAFSSGEALIATASWLMMSQPKKLFILELAYRLLEATLSLALEQM